MSAGDAPALMPTTIAGLSLTPISSLLLFAFFVVLYASAQVDQRKVGQLALAIQVAFQELGVFSASTTKVPTRGRRADAIQHRAGYRECEAQHRSDP